MTICVIQNTKYDDHVRDFQPSGPTGPELAAPSGSALHRPAIHRELLERLRDMIVDGTLPSGADINERELCEQFGVSRTPLREALLVLAAEGLMEMVPRRGARVVSLGNEQTRELLELLGGMEGVAGALACARATDTEIEAIASCHGLMMERYASRDMLAYFKFNERIHDMIVAAAHNRELAAQHGRIRNRVLRSLYVPNMSSQRWHDAVQEHEGFIAALRMRDGQTLGERLREHKQNTWRELCRLLASDLGASGVAAAQHRGKSANARKR